MALSTYSNKTPAPLCDIAEPKLVGFILVKKVSRYMLKKYGYAKAFDINLKKALKKR